MPDISSEMALGDFEMQGKEKLAKAVKNLTVENH
jgi:hypothetical protein